MGYKLREVTNCLVILCIILFGSELGEWLEGVFIAGENGYGTTSVIASDVEDVSSIEHSNCNIFLCSLPEVVPMFFKFFFFLLFLF